MGTFGETRQCGGSTTVSARRWEGQTALVRIPAAGHEAAQIDGSDRCSLATEEIDEFRDDLIRRFFHQPVPGMTDDDAFNIRRHKPALLDQDIA
jgi:hypothetical protein